MQIPGREDHALVVASDNLPPRWEQHLMSVVESPEGQGDPDLGNVLGRRLMPDTTETLLQALHNSGLLRPVPIDNVIMFPEPNRPYSLRQILQAMGRVMPDEYAAVDSGGYNIMESASTDASLEPPLGIAAVQAQDGRLQDLPPVDEQHQPRFNPHLVNQAATVSEGNIGIANQLMMEADDLEAVAAQKRAKAYEYAPQLRPAPKAAAKLASAKPAEKASKSAASSEAKDTSKSRPRRSSTRAKAGN